MSLRSPLAAFYGGKPGTRTPPSRADRGSTELLIWSAWRLLAGSSHFLVAAFGVAGSSHSILQFGRAFCSEPTVAGVTFVLWHLRVCRFRHVSSGDKSATIVESQFRIDRGIFLSGDKLDTDVLL